ncbi:integral membrane protein [Dothidotthia symphoricarpi CBS 119687]|uniref:Integral membrane protein n=1 Tax=Dothidotthia symphoricarpi CBS 119687 TaxID=1392245 RepID=A0A6A5ZY83_9PLEO|nr:uncharacterized protein P153DRAFT_350581 [Dothidotthia symphoricarpi CBS 119687]KAF2124499.1 integral membrane protein [Dothidotthia symphoricarpi CBS 119687]
MAATSPRNAAPPRLHSRPPADIPSLQPTQSPPRSRRKGRTMHLLVLLLAAACFLGRAEAVFVNFENCLDPLYLGEVPFLTFTPMYVWAAFDTEASRHKLNVTVYGNVSGQATPGPYPALDSDNWTNKNKSFGKIINVDPVNNKYTTLFSSFKVLSYSAWTSQPDQFCANTLNSPCPVGPAFFANSSDPYSLPAFSIAHDFSSAYSFATWESTLSIVSGDARAVPLGCVSANLTPDLGSQLSGALAYMPAAVLGLVALATMFAATCSPWGTSNIFRWTSNYGRDEDLLRLVTPGFGDCLQYIQFIVLAGSLTLDYPGFFQPVVSQASWSLLLFNESFVSQGDGFQSLEDGLYFANGTYGLTRLGQYVGMSDSEDIWACMAIFLLVLVAVAITITQIGFVGRWFFRLLTNTQDGDLRGKNWSFTAGNIVRIVFNYFLLPIISLSLFQLVVAPRSSASVIATAVVLLLGVMGLAAWIFWLIFTTRPRAHLFDDLPTVLTYGPLYNTYSDDAAPFAFIPVLLTTIRGIAVGAIQPSGIAQIIMLAICEVIMILTLHAFRPFQSNTSMNAYHTFFSVVRLTCVLLSVAFVPTLGVSEGPRGWIGYAILLLHGIVLVFGFFLNSLQTLIEVAARMAGAGTDTRGGLTKVFGKRQLSKRTSHRHGRGSMNSNAAMLGHDENKSIPLINSRSRSLSASSAVLLNQHYDRDSQRVSTGFDQFSQGDYGNISPDTPGTNATPFHFLGGGSSQNSRRPTINTNLDSADPYYRPPRARKHTMDSMIPGAQVRAPAPTGGADIADAPYTDHLDLEAGDNGEGPSRTRSTITPAYLRMNRDDSDPNLERRNQTDYTVRESDFYYGLRGPALSSQPTRKLKTGPADPMSPVSSATGWFKSLNLLGGRKKEKSKGFEVVRSTRMPPQMAATGESKQSPEVPQEPYHDSPATSPETKKGELMDSAYDVPSGGLQARRSQGHKAGVASAGILEGKRRQSIDSESSQSEDTSLDNEPFDDSGVNRISDIAPSLGPIEMGGGIELPSRIGSRASHATRRQPSSRTPHIPRRSSRRTPSTEAAILQGTSRLSAVLDSPIPSQHLQPLPIRLPFGSSEPSPERSPASSIYRDEAELAPAPATRGQRLNTGYVQHHVTKDSLQNDGYDVRNHLEASAEFVDRSRSGSTTKSGTSHRLR